MLHWKFCIYFSICEMERKKETSPNSSDLNSSDEEDDTEGGHPKRVAKKKRC